ncbi:MAG: YkgJ family cysteine cluster protein [Desulfotignum sp.]|nr:YkgJ family cysteine cluster protein [Desulfotignum sp.]MCF8113873.1 YkgJ family cysteine cluster protein [Desulfotignum sp.]MCF8126261.1 YkgJ family cysteine cluster protein [Desulfotignum sp.]
MASEYNTPDDIFECRLCGQCCTGFGGTYVTPEDIWRISKYIAANPDTFVSCYCDMTGNGPVLTQGADERCIFFNRQKQCTIHPVKPRMCKAWPFLETILRHPENWDAMASACPGITPSIPSQDLKRIVAAQIKNRGF